MAKPALPLLMLSLLHVSQGAWLDVSSSSFRDYSVQAAKACSLSFLPPAAIPYSKYSSGLRYVAQVEDPASLAGATILSCDDRVIIACRGSASLPNFRTNLNVGPAPLITAAGPHPTAKVHAGFQAAAQQLWERLEPLLPSGELLVTGHSLGGGTATLLALYAREAGRDAELLTVAGPRLGNGAFATVLRESGPLAAHLVHDEDAVLNSNVELWDRLGFEHVGKVVRCDMSVARIYGEQEAGAQSSGLPSGPPSLKGILVDHCRYLGVYIGVRIEHPSVWLRAP